MSNISKKHQLLLHMRESLPFFAKQCLKIRDKGGNIVPFELNAAQLLAHKHLEAQRAEKGYVRALLLKARQQGFSTYTAARYYWRASLWKGVNVYILAHEQTASDSLFGIVDRYQRNNPFRPHVGVANAKELVFDRLDSSYIVATAGKKAGGRSRSISLFHGSEVAFWANAKDHFSSSVQTVPLLPGTEIILESTSFGPMGEWYDRWGDAQAGKGEYIPIFVPWFMSDEYQMEVDPDFALGTEGSDAEPSEMEYAELYGLTNAQMAWRRSKIAELRSSAKFSQEYPATACESFVAADKESFIPTLPVLRARKRTVQGGGPLIMGVDPSGSGKDQFAVAFRRGQCVEEIKTRTKLEAPAAALWLKTLIDEHDPSRAYVDLGNIGAAVVSNLIAFGPKYGLIVRGVNFGAPSEHRNATPNIPGPWNRRAEMYDRLSKWLKDDAGADIPDIDALQADITAAKMCPRADGNFQLESKEDMRRRGVKSPDLSDSVALTFASIEYIPDYAEKVRADTCGNSVDSRPPSVEQAVKPNIPTGWMC